MTTVTTTESPLLSPCESCSTLLLNDQVDFDNQLFQTYLQSRISNIDQYQEEDQDLNLIFNHQEIVIKLCSVLNLINSMIVSSDIHLSLPDLTTNHLLMYLYYNQICILGTTKFYINEISLIHLGKSYKFDHKKATPIDDLNIKQFSSFLVSVHKPESSQPSIYQYFNLQNFINENLNLKNEQTGSVAYIEGILGKISNKASASKTTEVTRNGSVSSTDSAATITTVSTVTHKSKKSKFNALMNSSLPSKSSESLIKVTSRPFRRSLKRFFFNE
ncbi:uncharacterized protein RJT20DRAFT_132940 [Scheffersomyces xylosifermentans]|uniref:uncharacterized protein n=1 Tax=Scheffersomyces xylosifermentans TaxID=1304137 RepID=UPI00315CBD94